MPWTLLFLILVGTMAPTSVPAADSVASESWAASAGDADASPPATAELHRSTPRHRPDAMRARLEEEEREDNDDDSDVGLVPWAAEQPTLRLSHPPLRAQIPSLAVLPTFQRSLILRC